MNYRIVVVCRGGIESALLPMAMDGIPFTLAASHLHAEEFRDFFGTKDVLEAQGESACHVYNRAALDSSGEADHVVLLDSSNVEFIKFEGKGRNNAVPFSELDIYLKGLCAFMEALEAGCGGFTHPLYMGLAGLHPYSTVRAVSPFALVVDRRRFMGVRDLPFPYCLYDYQLRSLHAHRSVVRCNLVGTPYPDLGEGLQQFQNLWHASDIKLKRVRVDKKEKQMVEFSTALEGI